MNERIAWLLRRAADLTTCADGIPEKLVRHRMLMASRFIDEARKLLAIQRAGST